MHGLLIGHSFIGTAGDDAKLISAYAFEQATGARKPPKLENLRPSR